MASSARLLIDFLDQGTGRHRPLLTPSSLSPKFLFSLWSHCGHVTRKLNTKATSRLLPVCVLEAVITGKTRTIEMTIKLKNFNGYFNIVMHNNE